MTIIPKDFIDMPSLKGINTNLIKTVLIVILQHVSLTVIIKRHNGTDCDIISIVTFEIKQIP